MYVRSACNYVNFPGKNSGCRTVGPHWSLALNVFWGGCVFGSTKVGLGVVTCHLTAPGSGRVIGGLPRWA